MLRASHSSQHRCHSAVNDLKAVKRVKSGERNVTSDQVAAADAQMHVVNVVGILNKMS
jgi:hypothetical protein